MDLFTLPFSTYSVFDFSTYVFFYGFFALPAYAVFWRFKQSYFALKRIQLKRRATSIRLRSEIRRSLVSFCIFTVVDLSVYALVRSGHTLIYRNVSDFGVTYLCFSVFLMLVIHDAYFYASHRLMHWRPFYKHIHAVHHASVDPTPFTAFSFHPVEALLEGGVNYVIVFLIPTHLISLTLFQLLMTALNVLGHLGYELYPKGFTRHGILKWLTTSTHHNLHHERFNGNYGLYFSYLDKIFKTEFREYHESFEGIHKRAVVTSQTNRRPEVA